MPCKTAILFFTLTPYQESGIKTLHYDELSNGKVIRGLYHRTKALLQRQSLPVLEINEDLQQGDQFGDRLMNAVHQVFERDYDHVIIVGNDCPFLSLGDLRKAKKALCAGRQVIGESTDGGAYLIGISRSLFSPQLFKRLPWNTSCLGSSLRAYFLRQGLLVLLNVKSDVDDVPAFSGLLKRCLYLPIIRGLLQLFSKNERPVFFIPGINACTYHLQASGYRGPPC